MSLIASYNTACSNPWMRRSTHPPPLLRLLVGSPSRRTLGILSTTGPSALCLELPAQTGASWFACIANEHACGGCKRESSVSQKAHLYRVDRTRPNRTRRLTNIVQERLHHLQIPILLPPLLLGRFTQQDPRILELNLQFVQGGLARLGGRGGLRDLSQVDGEELVRVGDAIFRAGEGCWCRGQGGFCEA